MYILKKVNFVMLISLLPLSVEAATYRWIDAKGKTHYSNSIPASDSQLGYEELNKNGIIIKTIISAKKNRQIKELAKIRKEQKELTAKRKKEQALKEERDISLLSLYSSEDEIVSAYNSKLRQSQLTIDLLKSRHKKQSDLLASLETKLDRSKVIKHRRTLGKQIDETLDNLTIYQQAITENVVENDRVREEFKKTLNHFKKLVAKVMLSK